jgi:(R,R)-butanediol dehydrogenase/meso-butanediol dehydrogenase/diacetyl reductase
MQAVRLHGVGDLRFESVGEPGPLADGAVRVRVAAAGVCGSDLHNFRTGQWMARLPTIPGHEFAGHVLEIGRSVEGLKVGDAVVGDSRVTCGVCPRCRDGRSNICERIGYVGEVCDGAFAQIIDLPADRLLALPAGIPPEVGALSEPLGVALRVIRRLDPALDSPILIAGAGPIGGLAALLLEHLGYGPLAIVDRNSERAALVAEVSRARVIAPDRRSVAEFLTVTGHHKSGLGLAIEATGSPDMLAFLIEALDGGGRLAMVGVFGARPPFDANTVVERELELRGCSVFCGEQHEVLPMLAALRPALERVISPPIDLAQVPGEYQRLIAGGSPFLKTIIRP